MNEDAKRAHRTGTFASRSKRMRCWRACACLDAGCWLLACLLVCYILPRGINSRGTVCQTPSDTS
eukprot:37274-Eustigmatos_ZCMA.PRE.1